MLGGRASRNVLLTLLGAGVVGSGVWGGLGGSDCRSQRYATREACEATRGAGQCRELEAGGPWLAANCPRYAPRSSSGWWGGHGGYGYRGGSLGAPPSQTRSGSAGRFDAPSPSGTRSGSSGSSRGGFGSVGSSRSGSS